MSRKGQEGITLIALVITIIVLLILAGVAIAMLTGDNGIITNTNDSNIKQIEGKVKEEVKLAVQSAKLFTENKSIANPSWVAGNNGSEVIKEMEKDLKSSNDGKEGYTIKEVDKKAGDGETTFDITYKSGDYRKATNDENAQMYFQITVKQQNFSITAISHTLRKTDTTFHTSEALSTDLL